MDFIEKVKIPKKYVSKESVDKNPSIKASAYKNTSIKNNDEKEQTGKKVFKSLYYIAGLIVISSVSWYIFQKKRH